MQQNSCLQTGSRVLASAVNEAWGYGTCVCLPGSHMQLRSLQHAYILKALDWGMLPLPQAGPGFEDLRRP